MATAMFTKGARYLKNRMVAKLVTENRQPCVFCDQDVDDEVIYGKLYALGDIQCHYFCVLLSCCLVQKGRDTEGLFGFLYKDILAEVERSKKHKCSYCGRGGASLGCCITSCRKQFHLPCGRRKNVVSLFYGTYKSFCERHAPKQKISDSVMANAKERMKREKLIRAGKIPSNGEDNKQTEQAMVCVICYEEVLGYPTTETFWPPCCGRDAWLHRPCLQRMALSAGMHYMKCPLCNDKDTFYEAVSDQGYYLPDRDAAWELEQNAFAEIYNRDLSCAADDCKCPFGRAHDEPGTWDIKLCLLCGSWGAHAHCLAGARPLCEPCRPAAAGLDRLEGRLAAVIAAERAREQQNCRSGPVMPSRMSLRRTKGRPQPSSSSSSQNLPIPETAPRKTECQSLIKERLSLNLKPPRRHSPATPNLRSMEAKLLSPIKMLEQSYWEKGGGGDVVVTSEVIEKIRLKFSKPKPLCAKKKNVDDILDELFKNVKSKEPVREWNSPKKSFDVTISINEESKENVEQNINANTFETTPKDDLNPEKDVEMVTDINDSTDIEVSKKIDEECEKEKDPDQIENTNIMNHEAGEPDGVNLNANDKTVNDNETDKTDDESSTSTFQLPSEFIAHSDDSLPIFDTPKKLTTIDITHDSSLEISEQEEKVNINVVQIDSVKETEFIKNITVASSIKNKICSFKFSPADEQTLQTKDVDIDVESFKDQYLSEVGRDSRHNTHLNNAVKFCTHINLTKDTATRKRKLDMDEKVSKKSRKNKFKSKMRIKMDDHPDNPKIRKTTKMLKRKGDPEAKGRKIAKKPKRAEVETLKAKENIAEELQNATKGELDGKHKRRAKKVKKIKEKKILKNKHASIKIKLKDESKMKTKSKKKQKVKSYKQYILKYSPLQTDKVIAKPELDVSPIRRKYLKQEKPCDKLVQTSIQSFFKTI